jgi:hypothetical protein
VDTSHAVLQPGTTRRAAYVALTRGRESNTAYVVCERDGDEHHHEPLTSTARAQLTAILATLDDDTTGTAEQARRTALDEARSLAWIAGQWDLIATDTTRADCDRTITALLPAITARQVLAEPGYPRLCRALRGAELTGHDPTALLAEVIGERSLFNADSISDVLRWRIHITMPARTPERDPATGWAGITHPRPGPVGKYLTALANAADIRQSELGAHVLDEQPGWAIHHLGPPPGTAADREEWSRRAGVIAAYRELTAIPDTAVSLGSAPSREQALHRTLWQQATTAAGTPADALDYTTATEHELRQMRTTYHQQLLTAPAYVLDELADARLAATGYTHDAILWNAEAQLLPPDTPERDLADSDTRSADYLATTYTARAEELAVTAEARQRWLHSTEPERTRYELAGDELVHRGLPRDPTPYIGDQLALLAPELHRTTPGARVQPKTPTYGQGHDAHDNLDQLSLSLLNPAGATDFPVGHEPAHRANAATEHSMTTDPATDRTRQENLLRTPGRLWNDTLDRLQRWASTSTVRGHTGDDPDLAHRHRTYAHQLDTDQDRALERADTFDLSTGD